MQSMKSCDEDVYQTLKTQILNKSFKPQNQVYNQISQFLSICETETVQVPDMSFKQIEELMSMNSSSTCFKDFQKMLLKLQQYLIDNKIQDSSFEVTCNGEVKTFQRMGKKQFETIYSKMKNKNIKEFIDNLNENLQITPDQVRILLSTFDYNAPNKKKLEQFLIDLEKRIIKKEVEICVQIDCQELFYKQKFNVNEINLVYQWLLKGVDVNLELEQCNDDFKTIVNKYQDVMQQICNLCQYKGILHQDLYTAFHDTLPKIIFKSLQIMSVTSRYDMKLIKKVNCVLFGLIVPVVYLSDIQADCLVVLKNKQDIHLKTNNVMIHKQVMQNVIDENNIIHHINGNQFDNRIENLIEVIVDDSDRKIFKDNYSSFNKHYNLHLIFNTEYKNYFFLNCIDLKYFEQNLTYYKNVIQNINKPELLKYELDSSYVIQPVYNMQQFMNWMFEFTKQI